MAKKGQKKKKPEMKVADSAECCEGTKVKMMCCEVQAIISMDGRGQVVLPKIVRKKAKLKAGDKFAVVTSEYNGEVCCIMLLKADDFADTIKGAIGPMMKNLVG